MQDLYTVVRELGGFPEAQMWYDARRWDKARIGAEEAGYVLPQKNAIGSKRSCEQRCRQIGTAASECDHLAARSSADESWQYR
jgi:hypothetical protein